MRWMHPPEIERPQQRARFDPVVEGHRHGLSRDLALAIWATAQADATDGAGRCDVGLAQQRFHELAARVAAHRGQLQPDVGRVTQVAAAAEPGARGVGVWSLRSLIAPVPGRDTLVEADARRTVVAERTVETTPLVSDGVRGTARGWTAPAPVAPSGLDLRAWTPRHATATALPPGDAVPRANPPLAGWLERADRAARVREAARLYGSGELAAALRRGEPGLADAVAAALHDGAILAPHPVDVFRDSVRGIGAELTAAGRNVGRTAARLLRATPLAPLGERALAFADGVSGGAVRAWSERARGWADGMARRAMAWSDGAAARGAEHELARLSAAGGAPLPDALRAGMEALFGHRFGHVRIHTDADAVQAAVSAGARAVTLGSHIYFNRDQFAPGSEAGDRLLLHELTHVVQHDLGKLPDPASGRVELSSPSDPAEREARAMESRVGELRTPGAGASTAVPPRAATLQTAAAERGAAAGQPAANGPTAAAERGKVAGQAAGQAAAPARAVAQPRPAHEAPRPGKRASADGGLLGWVDDRIHDAENWAEDKIESAVLSVAPGLATLIKEGPGGLIKNAIQPAIQSWVGTVTGGVDIGKIAGQLKQSFSSAFAVLQGAKTGDARCCETLVNGINAIREVAHAFMNNPVMDAIKSVFTRVSDIVNTVTKLVIGPAFEVLKTLVGGAWDAIQGVASTIQGWLNAVKNIASKAFDWVAQKLGFPSGTGEGGLLDWLKDKAAQIWEDIKKTLQPVIGPLKVVGGVLLMFTGLPEIYAIVKYGPQIVEAIQWLWANRNNPEAVKQNPGLIGGSILPKILGAGQGFVAVVKQGVSWLVEKITAFATGALQLAGAITGIPLLGMAHGFVQTVVDGVQGIQQWATGAFTSAQSWLEGLFHQIADFIKPYSEVLCSIGTALVNPVGIPGILAGWAWRWLPDCIKPPLIDLLLDAVIGFLRGMPSLPMLGPLWPLLKSGVLGFLEALRGKDDKTKIAVSNKLAKIISGASPMFLFGFVKGLLKGVWDGIKMPFEAIWLVAKGIEKAGDFFRALGTEADTKATPAPAHPAAPATKAGATPAAPHPAMPGVPSVIRPDQASSVVGGIVSQLNAQKPAQVPHAAPPGAQSAAAPPAGNANQYRELGREARRMRDELSGPGKRIATGFWPAVQELFSGGKGMSIDDLMAKLNKVWEAAKHAVHSLGAKIANMIVDFLMKDSAEEEIGETIGYLVGMIAFQALLDYLSAGTWTGAMAVISGIAKFLNWPMEFLGEAMGLLKKLGGFILDGLKSLGKMAADAAAGALHEVLGAFREIGTKLGEFADELLSKFGGKTAEKDAARTLESDAARTAESDAARDAGAAKDGKPGDGGGEPVDGAADSAAAKEAQKAAELPQAIAISRSIATAEDVGGVPGPAIAVSLDALKARYSWIKAYEAVPNATGFEIFLIASRFSIIQAHNRMSQLPMDVQIQFSGLSDSAITKFAALDDAALTRFATLDEAALIKFGELDEAALLKFGELDEAALAKFAKLDRTALENFGALRELNMLEAYGQLSDEALAKFAKLDRRTLEKFAGWAHNNPKPILENIALQNDETIELLSTLKIQPESKAINASAPFETIQIRAPGMTYQIDRGTISHVLERHHPDFWIGEVKQLQSFLPRSLTPADIADVIKDVFNQNRDKILARGAGTFQVEGASHGFRWTVGFKEGRIGQLYPKF